MIYPGECSLVYQYWRDIHQDKRAPDFFEPPIDGYCSRESVDLEPEDPPHTPLGSIFFLGGEWYKNDSKINGVLPGETT